MWPSSLALDCRCGLWFTPLPRPPRELCPRHQWWWLFLPFVSLCLSPLACHCPEPSQANLTHTVLSTWIQVPPILLLCPPFLPPWPVTLLCKVVSQVHPSPGFQKGKEKGQPGKQFRQVSEKSCTYPSLSSVLSGNAATRGAGGVPGRKSVRLEEEK